MTAQLDDSQILDLLNELRKRFGRLQVAHVHFAREVLEIDAVSPLAQYLGVSRSAVRLALQQLSEMDIKEPSALPKN